MRGWLTVAFVLLLLLAGCASNSDTTSSSSASRSASSHPPTTSGTGTATATAAPATPAANRTNHPPSAGLVAHAGNGTAALNVTFALTGSDPDGDALNWTLAFGDGNQTAGAVLPSNVTHAYKVGGRLNATLTVRDGHNSTTATVALNLTAGAPKVVQTATGKWSASSQDCPGATSTAAPATAYFPGPLKGINYDSAAVDPATQGQKFVAAFTPAGDSAAVLFADASGKVLLRVNPAGSPLSGVVPAGAATVYFFSCISEPDSMAMTYQAY